MEPPGGLCSRLDSGPRMGSGRHLLPIALGPAKRSHQSPDSRSKVLPMHHSFRSRSKLCLVIVGLSLPFFRQKSA